MKNILENIFKTLVQRKAEEQKTIPVSEVPQNLQKNMEVSQETVMLRKGAKKTTLRLILDYLNAVEEDEDSCSVLVGDSADAFKQRNPSLQVVNPRLKIGGTYGVQTLSVFKEMLKTQPAIFYKLQGNANLKEAWDAVTPLTYLESVWGADPSANVIDLQAEIGPDALNLTVRLEKEFNYMVGNLSALQFQVSKGFKLTYNLDMWTIGSGSNSAII